MVRCVVRCVRCGVCGAVWAVPARSPGLNLACDRVRPDSPHPSFDPGAGGAPRLSYGLGVPKTGRAAPPRCSIASCGQGRYLLAGSDGGIPDDTFDTDRVQLSQQRSGDGGASLTVIKRVGRPGSQMFVAGSEDPVVG